MGLQCKGEGWVKGDGEESPGEGRGPCEVKPGMLKRGKGQGIKARESHPRLSSQNGVQALGW